MSGPPSENGGDPLLQAEFLRSLERLDLEARRLMRGEGRGETSSARRGPGTLFFEHRRYLEGDDLRFVDMGIWLRTGELHVKDFEAEEAPRVALLWDRSRSVGLPDDRGGFLRQLTAAVGWVALGRHASLLVASWPGELPPLPLRGGKARPRLLRALAEPPLLAGEGFRARAEEVAPKVAGGLVIVLSDLLETAGFPEGLQALRAARAQVRVVHLRAPETTELPRGRRVRLVDAETGRARTLRVGARLARAYAEEVEEHWRRLRAECARMAVPWAEIDPRRGLQEAVLSLLRHGILRR